LGLLLLCFALSGCSTGPVWLGAALGFGASALKLDDDVFVWYVCQKDTLAAKAQELCK
jgi:hypothetical protein